jgi:hypothetical protein
MTDREFRHVQGELDEVIVKLKAALDPLAARGARIEFRKRERRRLIEWFASKDIEKIEDAEFWAIRPIKALQQEKKAQKQLSLLVLPLPRLARTQQHP